MADKKITQLTNITGANLVDADEFVVVDISADETKAVTRAEFFKNVPDVGIGTASPVGQLDVTGDNPALYIRDTKSITFVGGEEMGRLGWYVNDSSGIGPRENAYVKSVNGSTSGTTSSSNLAFGTAAQNATPTERMRIDDDGNVAIGITSNPGYRLSVVGAGTVQLLNRTGATGVVTLFQYAGTNVGTIAVTASSTAYNTSSDYRLKTDAQPMVGASARVQALNPVNFEWISDGTRVDGFLAHEAQAIVPEAVTGTKDAMKDEEYEVTAAIEATYDNYANELTAAVDAVIGTRNVPDLQGIDQSKLVPLLTAALQEALTEITALKARVTALEE